MQCLIIKLIDFYKVISTDLDSRDYSIFDIKYSDSKSNALVLSTFKHVTCPEPDVC